MKWKMLAIGEWNEDFKSSRNFSVHLQFIESIEKGIT